MKNDIGSLGEELVAYWLQTQGWSILYRRWHCRWGELDIVALQSQTRSSQVGDYIAQVALAFVEVKTRSSGNWDTNGLLAITPQKQAKLWKTAQLFLAQHSALADLPCRFDVASVCCKQLPSSSTPLMSMSSQEALQSHLPISLNLGEPVQLAGYQLTLQTYIESAFYV
jgi:putative endonuclease